jgi:hypothetical protein
VVAHPVLVVATNDLAQPVLVQVRIRVHVVAALVVVFVERRKEVGLEPARYVTAPFPGTR